MTASTVRARTDLHLELALAYLEKNQPQSARLEAEQALTLMPTSGDALHVMALIDLALGDTEAARLHFQQALESQSSRSDTSHIGLLLNYSTFLCHDGQMRTGRALLRRAVQATPSASEATRIERLFKKCEKLS